MAQLAPENKSLSLSTRKNIKDREAEKEKYLKQIEEATGVAGWTYDFQGDLAAFNNAVEAGMFYFIFISFLFKTHSNSSYVPSSILSHIAV